VVNFCVSAFLFFILPCFLSRTLRIPQSSRHTFFFIVLRTQRPLFPYTMKLFSEATPYSGSRPWYHFELSSWSGLPLSTMASRIEPISLPLLRLVSPPSLPEDFFALAVFFLNSAPPQLPSPPKKSPVPKLARCENMFLDSFFPFSRVGGTP